MSEPFVHPTAVLDEGAEIGLGTKVWHFVHVSEGASVGAGCVLGQNVYVAPGVRIGDRVRIQNNVSLYQGVHIEDDVFLGPSCVFTNVNVPRAFVSQRNAFVETRVERGASIGANATVVCGHTLGAYSLVGAGAVVTRDVEPYALVVGNPARRRGWVCMCGARLAQAKAPSTEQATAPASFVCSECNRSYRIQEGRCRPEGNA